MAIIMALRYTILLQIYFYLPMFSGGEGRYCNYDRDCDCDPDRDCDCDCDCDYYSTIYNSVAGILLPTRV